MSVSADEIVVALYDYTAKDPEELSIRKNEQLNLIEAKFAWWKVRNGSGKFGLVPSNYLRRDKAKGESLVNRIANKLPGGKKGKLSNPPGPAVHTGGGGGGGGGSVKGLLHPSAASNLVPAPSSQLNEEYVSKFDYVATKDDELSLTKGMCVLVLKTEEDGWWYGKDANRPSNPGWFPSNYVTKNVPNTAANNTPSKPPTIDNGNCLLVVRALYPFNTDNSEELGFEQDELLDIVEEPPDDPEWYLAKNSNGHFGLIPKNYVEVASDANPVSNQNGSDLSNPQNDVTDSNNHQKENSGPLANVENKDWFFGPLKRSEAEALLNGKAKNGEFLVRNCETAAGEFSISMKMPGRIRHFKIIVLPNGEYGIGQKRFDSIENLLDHYKRSPIFTNTEQGKFYLTNPLPR